MLLNYAVLIIRKMTDVQTSAVEQNLHQMWDNAILRAGCETFCTIKLKPNTFKRILRFTFEVISFAFVNV
jgi:hypothetical protein